MNKIFSALLLSTTLFAVPALFADIVNLNEATAAALQKNLKGVGEKKAQAIIAYRQEFGAFKTLDEIKEVKGIGDGIFKKIKADLSLSEGVTELAKKSSKKSAKAAKTEAKTKIKKNEKKLNNNEASNEVSNKVGQDVESTDKEAQKSTKKIKPAGNRQNS